MIVWGGYGDYRCLDSGGRYDPSTDAWVATCITRLFYQDSDGDGFGNPTESVYACVQPSDYATNTLDCDPERPLIHPGALEVCNGLDDDCNGQIDEDSAGSTRMVTASTTRATTAERPRTLTRPTPIPMAAAMRARSVSHSLMPIYRGRVDGLDLARLGRAFGADCLDPRFDPAVDFDRNCEVDGDDVALLASFFGTTVP